MKTSTIVIGFIVLVVLGVVVVKYNSLATADERLMKEWTPLYNVLKPRYDEVPKLVNEIILYTGKEDAETKALVQAHKEFVAEDDYIDSVKTADKLETALSDIFIQAGQRYPGISSHYQFMYLQQGFQKSSDQMLAFVQGYNNAVDKYNEYIRKFPNNLVAVVTGFETRAPYFKRK